MSVLRVLFYRDFKEFSGGHQKVFDYFGHFLSHPNFEPAIAFSKDSRWDLTNPWKEHRDKVVEFRPDSYDYVFLAGMDWQVYKASEGALKKPVINLIQHVRHAKSGEDVHPFLTEPAVRICVSKEVEAAIAATGKVRGPLVTIENGVSLPAVKKLREHKMLIAGLKKPALGKLLQSKLAVHGIDAKLLLSPMPRSSFFEELAQCQIAVLLPNETEGFYLPALEAMQFSELVIVPDCVGNRSFCTNVESNKKDGNCLMPDYKLDSLVSVCRRAVMLLEDKENLANLQRNAQATVAHFSLKRERQAFYGFLDEFDDYWAQI